MKQVTMITLLEILLLSCAPKPFQWQGKYISINTTEQPKEDFIVGDYIVIAYAPCEYKKNPATLYKFALIMGGRQVGLIILEYDDLCAALGNPYFLEENNVSRKIDCGWLSRIGNHVTYNYV